MDISKACKILGGFNQLYDLAELLKDEDFMFADELKQIWRKGQYLSDKAEKVIDDYNKWID